MQDSLIGLPREKLKSPGNTFESYVHFLLNESDRTPLEKLAREIHKESLKHLSGEKRKAFDKVLEIIGNNFQYEDTWEIAIYKQGYQDATKLYKNGTENLKPEHQH
jgi:hypothetical protein